MKNLILLAVYLVTWKTMVGKFNESAAFELGCKCEAVEHSEQFGNYFKAVDRFDELSKTPEIYDVRMWKMEEPAEKERVK